MAVREESFDFGAEADSAITVGLIADVDDTGAAIGFFLGASSSLGGNAESRLNGHANLERSRRREIEPAARDIQNFREMFGFVRG